MEEEEKKMQIPLNEDDLDAVSGGKFVTDRTEVKFCPYCIKKHPIQVIRGKHKVGKHMHTLYWCKSARQYFIKAVNGYFDIHDDRLPTGTITID